MIKKLKFKKLDTLPWVIEPESVWNSELKLVLADSKALILHDTLDPINLFGEGLPSKG